MKPTDMGSFTGSHGNQEAENPHFNETKDHCDVEAQGKIVLQSIN